MHISAGTTGVTAGPGQNILAGSVWEESLWILIY